MITSPSSAPVAMTDPWRRSSNCTAAARAAALERQPETGEPPSGGRVALDALALVEKLPIPGEPVRLEDTKDLAGAVGDDSWAVQVLDAHQPAPAVMAGIDIAAERGEQRAQMQLAGGRGGEASDVGGARGGVPPAVSGSGRRGRRTGARAAHGASAPRRSCGSACVPDLAFAARG